MAFRDALKTTSLLLAIFLSIGAGLHPQWSSAIKTLRAVGAEGQGNAAAAPAVKTLSQAKLDAVPAILAAMDGANDYALNWLRSAIEIIYQRETAAGQKPPLADLEKFLNDRKHHPRARRMAYELVARSDLAHAKALLPEFVNDPSGEMRRDAVQQIADRAASKAAADKPGAITDYRQALGFAREPDQIDAIAAKLKDLGEQVDYQKTFGWVAKWKMVGPFDNTGGVGFDKPFPPESNLNLDGEFDGKSGKVRWHDYESKYDYGYVDFNLPFTPLKEVTGYAYTEFWSEAAQTVQLRLGSEDSWKVWVNGKFLFGREEYHRAAEIDQFRLPIELKPGKNIILVKCLQNEQTEDWAKDWQFQLRITDADGTPIRSSRPL